MGFKISNNVDTLTPIVCTSKTENHSKTENPFNLPELCFYCALSWSKPSSILCYNMKYEGFDDEDNDLESQFSTNHSES